jgi:hypothetical protein
MKCQAGNTERCGRYDECTVELETYSIAMDSKPYGNFYVNGNNEY